MNIRRKISFGLRTDPPAKKLFHHIQLRFINGHLINVLNRTFLKSGQMLYPTVDSDDNSYWWTLMKITNG